MSARPQKFPITTVTVFVVTAIATALIFPFPQIDAALRRTPDMYALHEWWRIVTPVFINPEGWLQIVFNFTGIALLGTIVERRFGWARWLAIYFGSAVVGEIAGHAWKPSGAGSSVSVAGLLGAAAVLLATARAPQPRIGAVAIVIGAATLCYFRDLHGPPILMGAALAYVMHRIAHPLPPRRSMTRIV
ncbi:MAG: rhomboid family intramembrane serine protease [Candidatus Acidiferrales bacterium]